MMELFQNPSKSTTNEVVFFGKTMMDLKLNKKAVEYVRECFCERLSQPYNSHLLQVDE